MKATFFILLLPLFLSAAFNVGLIVSSGPLELGGALLMFTESLIAIGYLALLFWPPTRFLYPYHLLVLALILLNFRLFSTIANDRVETYTLYINLVIIALQLAEAITFARARRSVA